MCAWVGRPSVRFVKTNVQVNKDSLPPPVREWGGIYADEMQRRVFDKKQLRRDLVALRYEHRMECTMEYGMI